MCLRNVLVGGCHLEMYLRKNHLRTEPSSERVGDQKNSRTTASRARKRSRGKKNSVGTGKKGYRDVRIAGEPGGRGDGEPGMEGKRGEGNVEARDPSGRV